MRSEGAKSAEELQPDLSTGRCEGNDDGDGNENDKKAIDLISKTTTLRAFLCISLPSLHDYVNTRQQPSFPFPELLYSPLKFNS